MGGPVVFGAIVLIIFLLTGRRSEAAPELGPGDSPHPPDSRGGPGTYTQPAGPAGGPPVIPGTTTPISEVEPRDGADFERKRQMIAQSFTSALQSRAELSPKESQQAGINATAAYFRSKGIYIDRPNPQTPPTYYKQTQQQMASHLAETVNTYIQAVRRARLFPGAPTAPTPEPTVTTTPEEQKVAIVRKGYSDAIIYLIDMVGQRKGKQVTPPEALVPIAQYFSMFGIPHPNQLTLASQFWARTIPDISDRTSQALRYSMAQVDQQTGIFPSPHLPTVTHPSQLRAPTQIPVSGYYV